VDSSININEGAFTDLDNSTFLKCQIPVSSSSYNSSLLVIITPFSLVLAGVYPG